MLRIFNGKLRRLCFRFRWPLRRRPKIKIVSQKFGKSSSRAQKEDSNLNGSRSIHQNHQTNSKKPNKPIMRIATFNAALFSMAPAFPITEKSPSFDFRNENFSNNFHDLRAKSSSNNRPKSILKQSPLHPNSQENLSKQQKFAKSKLRVSINLPDNEISLKRSMKLSSGGEPEPPISRFLKGKGPLRSTVSLPSNYGHREHRNSTTVLQVLRELDADIVALQDVRAEEEKSMKPLSDLAVALGMNYVFAESWAPEFGNAVLSKWPIKRWNVQKFFDDSDFRNVLKATIDVPSTGEINFHCTHLDHLDENWRMKQINSIIQSSDGPHILAGGLNSLDETDYSPERWTDIVKYYEEMGKPTPKVEVMKFLKSKNYTDAKDFSGECESVVMIAKGQSVQGTCKYGTRVDYILGSPDSPYKFVEGSYSVLSSKGTSDHHIVKVDIVKVDSTTGQPQVNRKRAKSKQKVVKITNSNSSRGIWRENTDRI